MTQLTSTRLKAKTHRTSNHLTGQVSAAHIAHFGGLVLTIGDGERKYELVINREEITPCQRNLIRAWLDK